MNHKSVFSYCLIYLSLSVLLWLAIPFPEGHYDIDSWGYTSIAAYFAETGVLTDPHDPASAPVQPVGYPFFIGMLFKIFGNDMRPIFLIQILLMCIALMLTMLIAQRIAGKAVAHITGLFFLMTLGFYIYPQVILAETILVVLILFMLERYLVFMQTGRMGALLAAGLCAGLSMLIKPVVMLFMIALCALTWYVIRSMYHDVRRRACMHILLLLASFSVPVTVYILRNYVQYGHASFAPMMQLNMYQIFLAKVMGNIAGEDPQIFIDTELRFQGAHSFDSSGWDHARALFIKHMREYPTLCAHIWCMNVAKTWCGLYTSQLKKMIEPNKDLVGHSFFSQQGSLYERLSSYVAGGTSIGWVQILGWYECVWSLMRLLLACFGLYRLFQKDPTIALLLLGGCISFSIPTGIDGCCRYRIVFETILILLSAIGFLKVYSYYCIKKVGELRYEVSG